MPAPLFCTEDHFDSWVRCGSNLLPAVASPGCRSATVSRTADPDSRSDGRDRSGEPMILAGLSCFLCMALQSRPQLFFCVAWDIHQVPADTKVSNNRATV